MLTRHDGAAHCVRFYGFLWTAEFTVPNGKFDPSGHLAIKDVAVDCHNSSSLLQIRIKMFKTDQYKYRTLVYLATTNNELAQWPQYRCSRGCANPKWVSSISIHLNSSRREGPAKFQHELRPHQQRPITELEKGVPSRRADGQVGQ